MISLHNVTKKFEDVTAVDHLTIDFNDGVYGLIGQNGAGKSTLLRSIAGVIYLNDGEILVNGTPATKKEAKEQIFFLPDNPYVPSKTNIAGVFNFYSTFYDLDKNKFDELINKFELPRAKRVNTFSKGMLRQLFLAITFSTSTKILLLDEAFDGLDPLVLEIIREQILIKRADGVEIIISSHNLSTLEKIADHFVIIYKGKLAKEGENEDLGKEMIKYQAIFKKPITEKDLTKLGLNVISFKKVGSIINFVIEKDDEIEKKLNDNFDVSLLENIPLDPEEILSLQLSIARKEGKKDE